MAAGYIPQEILDEIIQRCDIVSVINEYVPLKRRGSNYQGLCPFHNEKTPSFSVSPGKKIFHCFGCGKGGNVFRFVMEIEGLTFSEAVEKLAKRVGVTLPEKELTPEQRRRLEQRKRYLQINDYVARFYHKVLMETRQGEPYLQYLHNRQISRDTMERFLLGATPSGWDTMYQMLKKHGVTDQEMLDLGLISASKRGNYIDRFRQRLMFPICNEKGETIAFGGRIIDKDSSPQKYLNSPETPLFHKSRSLYGLHLAKNQIRNQDMAILVEGYMDVISCHQFGVTNAVAPLGTAFTPEQGRMVMRHTYQVGIALDGDSAGIKATMRCLDILSDLGCTARVIEIPDGADPDEFLKARGADAFQQLISQAKELIMYKIGKYMETTNTDSIAGKLQVVGLLRQDLRNMKSAVAREAAVRQISQALQISEKAILEELQAGGRTVQDRTEWAPQTENKSEQSMIQAGRLDNQAEKNILRIVFEQPELFSVTEEYGGEALFGATGALLYQEFSRQLSQYGRIDSGAVPQEYSQLLSDLLMEDMFLTDTEKVLREALWQKKQEQLDREYQQLTQRLKQLTEGQTLGAVEEMKDVLQKLDSIRRTKKEYELSRKGEYNQ